MNAEVAYGYRERKAQAQAMGEVAHRLHCLQHLKLKTVIKESHCRPVRQLLFNAVDASCSNLFATVGGDQATVYDDMHMGDYIAVVLNFVNARTSHAAGQGLQALAWLSAEELSGHPNGDAFLAVAGSAGEIGVISLVEARVVSLITGHPGAVVSLSAVPGRPGMLTSLGRDGTVRFWDVVTQQRLATVPAEATAMAVSPGGDVLATGGRKGSLHLWQLQDNLDADPARSHLQASILVEDAEELASDSGAQHWEAVDSLRFLAGGRLASKSLDGRMLVWDTAQRLQLASWKVPGCSARGGRGEAGGFAATSSGGHICAGNSSGDVRVYDTHTGKQVALVSPIKVTGPVLACALSDDCRHLLAAVGNGYVFRYEYRKPKPSAPAVADADALDDDKDDAMSEDSTEQ
ncbi:hypothetical protein CVIRNUC_010203 [Coccomyxa viridis]|uniref:Uncharacterized protein n=1 Tax=Coccomyxa viridis TaxID=1274662 RepID=A0AAV1ILA1_9CHLO|nr:hypothetical protein CVIRNUC_010203 [Coccomyxa viridis]